MVHRTAARTILIWVAVIGLCGLYAGELAAQTPPYLNPDLPTAARVDDLVGRMTLAEKVAQMQNSAPAIERLNIPAYDWWNEALHGVAASGVATVFPQAIGLGAMWDTAHMLRVSTVISDEARAKYHEALRQGSHARFYGITIWSPNINIFRDPRWGRGQETYGEDPYLSGQMAIPFIKGLQGDDPKYLKTVSTVKHFAVHSGPEPERHVFDALPSDRDLYETYLPQFRAGIIEGGAYSIMGSYNRVRGESGSASQLLLGDILRKLWNFQGYVVSDCGAIRDIYANHKIVATAAEGAALAVKRGCDLTCGSEYLSLVEAVSKGLITEKEIDVSVKRLFTARMKLGMFDPPERVKWTQIPFSNNDSPEHGVLAAETARKAIVLLKNAGNALPLSKNVRTIAVIGPNSDNVDALVGNYNGTPSSPITPLAGMRAKVGSSATVLYAKGCEIAEGMETAEQIPDAVFFTTVNGARRSGLTVEYYNNIEFAGTPVKTGVDPNVNVKWGNGVPFAGLEDGKYAVRWKGEFVAPVTGEYSMSVTGGGQAQITLDGQALTRAFGGARGGAAPTTGVGVPAAPGATTAPATAGAAPAAGARGTAAPATPGTAPATAGARQGAAPTTGAPAATAAPAAPPAGGFRGATFLKLEAGKSYPIVVDFTDRGISSNLHLMWTVRGRDLQTEALAAARKADVVVLFLGLSPRLEGEEMRVQTPGFSGGDRISIDLPAVQETLMKEVVAIGKPTVLVLLNGSALAVNWADANIPAIVEAWYPGQAAGTAIADVLFGDYNPAGRLPLTFYKSVDQLPAFTDYSMVNRTYKYFTGTPLYPFGHGLSYTTFAYRDLKVPTSVAAGKPVDVSVTVTNTGKRAGEEVVQVYVNDRQASAPVPIRKLVGFKRIALTAGESKTVSFTIDPRDLSLITNDTRRIIEPGVFGLSVGGKQPGFTGTADAATTSVVSGQFTVTGSQVQLDL